jgi:hypothetical protein
MITRRVEQDYRIDRMRRERNGCDTNPPFNPAYPVILSIFFFLDLNLFDSLPESQPRWLGYVHLVSH